MFAAFARKRFFSSGTVIYFQGEPGDELFRIVKGAVRLSVSRPDGKEAVFLHFAEGDCFGVSSLIDDEVRPQTAEAVGETILQVIGRQDFLKIRQSCPDFDNALLKLLALQMRVVSAHFSDSALLDLARRLGSRLLEFARERDGELVLAIPQNELAAMVGASRQAVNKALQDFQGQGFVSIGYNEIRILKADALGDFVAG